MWIMLKEGLNYLRWWQLRKIKIFIYLILYDLCDENTATGCKGGNVKQIINLFKGKIFKIKIIDVIKMGSKCPKKCDCYCSGCRMVHIDGRILCASCRHEQEGRR